MKKTIVSTVGVGLFAIGLALAPVVSASPLVTTILPSDLAVDSHSWYFYDDVADAASTAQVPDNYQFVHGPATPPAGQDSVQFSVTGSERWNMATAQYKDTKLSDLTSLKFNTYQPSTNPGSTQYSVYANFDVDFDGPGGNNAYQGRLVYVPRTNGTVTQNTWQEWSALDAGSQWTWSRLASNGNKWLDNNTNANRSWSDIVAAFPDATISGQLLFRAGEPYPAGFTGNLDKVTVGTAQQTTVYDFELARTPQDKDDCKKGGWQNFNSPVFKNQGQCVSYVEHHDSHGHDQDEDHESHGHHHFWDALFNRHD